MGTVEKSIVKIQLAKIRRWFAVVLLAQPGLPRVRLTSAQLIRVHQTDVFFPVLQRSRQPQLPPLLQSFGMSRTGSLKEGRRRHHSGYQQEEHRCRQVDPFNRAWTFSLCPA